MSSQVEAKITRVQFNETQAKKRDGESSLPLLLLAVISTVFLTACSLKIPGDSIDFIEISKAELRTEPLWIPDFSTLPELRGHSAEIINVFPAKEQFSAPEARAFISVDKAGKVLVWDRATSKGYLLAEVGRRVDKVVLSRSNRHLAFVSAGRVFVYALDKGRLLQSLKAVRSRVTTIAFQPGWKVLVMAGADGRIYRWKYGLEKIKSNLPEAFQTKVYERYVGHSTVVSSVTYHSFGRVFFSGDWTGNVSAWLAYDVDDFFGKYDEDIFGTQFFTDERRRVPLLKRRSESIDWLLSSVDGKYVVSASRDGFIDVYSVRGAQYRTFAFAHKGSIASLDINPSSTMIFAYGRNGNLAAYELQVTKEDRLGMDEPLRYELIPKVREDISGLTALKFVSDNAVVAGRRDGLVVEIDLSKLVNPDLSLYLNRDQLKEEQKKRQLGTSKDLLEID